MVHKTTQEPRAAQKRRREETREQILALAERVLADEGAEALVLHRLASTLGYRTSALYRYFDSKEALVLALLERAVDAIAERVRAGMGAVDALLDGARREPGERALLRLVGAAWAYVDVANSQPAHAALVARMLADPRPIVADALSAARAVPVAMGVVTDVSACFAVARSSGLLSRGNDAQRAALFWSSLEGLVTVRKMARFGVGGDFESLATGLVRTLLIGFGADPAQVDAALEQVVRSSGKMGGAR